MEEVWIISKPGRKIFWIKCEPLNGIKSEKHTDNATFDHYFTVSLQTVFRFSYYFFSLTEPPKTEILYVYTVCVHIQNHDTVE